MTDAIYLIIRYAHGLRRMPDTGHDRPVTLMVPRSQSGVGTEADTGFFQGRPPTASDGLVLGCYLLNGVIE